MMSGQHTKIFSRTDEYTVASYGPVLIQLWQRGAPLNGAEEARKAARELAGGFPQTGSLVIVPVESQIPEKAAREELSRIPIELTNGVGLVMVQEGTGFKASAVRAVLSTIMLISRRSMPHDVVPQAAPAATWLSKRLKMPGGAGGLLGAVNELRQFYGEQTKARLATG